MPTTYETDLKRLAELQIEKQGEHDQFIGWINERDNGELDKLAHSINNKVSAAIDCTACGNCCKTLVINVTHDEVGTLATHLNLTSEETKEKYIEESMAGRLFINTMPCHFLTDNKCTIYEARFTECRDFPHLHKTGFKDRLPGTLGHYGRCPIIYNVIEEMKMQLGFFD